MHAHGLAELTPGKSGDIIDIMAQFVVRNLEDDIRDRLRAMAAAHGRSMEEEVREILREAALAANEPTEPMGTRLAKRFAGCEIDAEIEELRGHPTRPADLGP